MTDLQKVQTYFANISQIGTYGLSPEDAKTEENNDDSKLPSHKSMTYLEKINHVKTELQTMFDDKKGDQKINNSVYRFGSD